LNLEKGPSLFGPTNTRSQRQYETCNEVIERELAHGLARSLWWKTSGSGHTTVRYRRSPGTARDAAGKLADLENSGELDKQRAKSLRKKLDKIAKALGGLEQASSSGDVTAQQQGSFLRELQRAIDALLDFISALTELVTELPAEVVQPIIDAAIELLRDLLGLLLGGGGA
jgi:hypothetical protein